MMHTKRAKIFLTVMVCLVIAGGCSGRPQKNRVNINQINPDNSNNYHYIFREIIEEERRQQQMETSSAFRE